MYGYIYLTTNLINDKKYIGKHRSEVFDEKYKGSGTYLAKAFAKYGFDNFRVELLKECESLDVLNSSEKEYIAKYKAVESKDFYNLANGGEGNTSKRTKRTIKKLKQSLTGRTLSEEHKLHVSESMKGKRTGQKMSEETKKKISLANKGRVMSEEHKRKIVESRRKNNSYWISEETREKLSLSHKKQVPWNKGLTKETDERVKKNYDRGRNNAKSDCNKKVVAIDI